LLHRLLFSVEEVKHLTDEVVVNAQYAFNAKITHRAGHTVINPAKIGALRPNNEWNVADIVLALGTTLCGGRVRPM
jgi:hypothetical protein